MPLLSCNITKDITIIHGDSLSLCSEWPSDAALITDPPYGMSYQSHHNSGRGDCDMLRKDGNFKPIEGDDIPFDPSPWLRFKYVCLFGAQHFASKLPDRRGWFVWDKLAGKTPCSQSDCELAWTNQDKPVRIFTHLWRGIMRDGEENVIYGGKLHPNQKPAALMRWAIKQLGVPQGTTVYDPFMGSGTVGLVCHRMRLRYVGVEIDRDHFETAKKRLQTQCQQLMLGLSG
jgi:site-specific DNA-methyltransferase (adenine-specific)/modification methylase